MKQTLTILAFALVVSLSGCKSVATKSLIRDAEQGNAAAQFELGTLYEKGSGVMQHPDVAAKWYRLAAEQGHAEAQYNLGRMYEKGWYWRGSFYDFINQTYTRQRTDYVEALKWYRLAADQGNAEAQYNLGAMYLKGNGVAQNALEAGRWYRLSAEQGHKKTKDEARLIDDTTEFETTIAAARQGNAKAQYELGRMYDSYRNGVVVLNHKEASEWYRRAAEQGDAQAQYQLSINYNYGRGVPQNIFEALKWCRLAAEQGHKEAITLLKSLDYFEETRQKAGMGNARAQYEMGRMYEQGTLVVNQSISEAKRWYGLAERQGYADAKTALTSIRYDEMMEQMRAENERLVNEMRAENERLARELREETERLEQERRALQKGP